jgi:hypothetical protein
VDSFDELSIPSGALLNPLIEKDNILSCMANKGGFSSLPVTLCPVSLLLCSTLTPLFVKRGPEFLLPEESFAVPLPLGKVTELCGLLLSMGILAPAPIASCGRPMNPFSRISSMSLLD